MTKLGKFKFMFSLFLIIVAVSLYRDGSYGFAGFFGLMAIIDMVSAIRSKKDVAAQDGEG
ncbi:hypothetical protein D3C87_1587420 [compost metagenome]